MAVVVMTGAAGRIGGMLRTRLARPGRVLRLLDIAPLTAGPGEEVLQASVTDLAALIVGLRRRGRGDPPGGRGRRGPVGAVAEVNITGTYAVFEAARRAGVSRVIYASSNHAVGFAPRSAVPGAGLRLPGARHLLRGDARWLARRWPRCTTTGTGSMRSACAS